MKASSSVRRARLGIEFGVLFVGMPLLLWFGLSPVRDAYVLWLFSLGCLVALLLDQTFPRRVLYDARNLGRHVVSFLPMFLVTAVVLTLYTALFEPQRLFGFVRARPDIWALVMLLYPILSVYPQGLVYRAFLLHRYRALFPRPWQLIAAGALAFAFMHIVFRNPIAPTLTLAGGVLFAMTHLRTSSLLISSVQHAMYGCLIFTLGLGWYFYNGPR